MKHMQSLKLLDISENSIGSDGPLIDFMDDIYIIINIWHTTTGPQVPQSISKKSIILDRRYILIGK